jgi:hypothetical protein
MVFNIKKFGKAFFKHINGMPQMESITKKINELIDETSEVDERIDNLQTETGEADSVTSADITISGSNAIVASSTYTLDGVIYTPAYTSLAITPYALNERVDIIVGTVDGPVLIEGTASATPVAPDVPSGQILLGYVYVTASELILTTSKIYYVSPIGNDATGVKGNVTKPFLTLGAVKALAVSGDEIWVLPGTYTINATLAKTGIIYRLFGATINMNVNGGNMLGTSENYKIIGDGKSILNQQHIAGSVWHVTASNARLELYNLTLNDARNQGSLLGTIRWNNSTSGGYIIFKNVTINSAQTVFFTAGVFNMQAFCENCTFTSTIPDTNYGNYFICGAADQANWLFKSCTFKGQSSIGIMIFSHFAWAHIPEVTFDNCVFLDSGAGTAITVGATTTATRLKFVGTNVISNPNGAYSIYKQGGTTLSPIIMGSLMATKTTGGDTITYPVASITVDSDITYTYPIV